MPIKGLLLIFQERNINQNWESHPETHGFHASVQTIEIQLPGLVIISF